MTHTFFQSFFWGKVVSSIGRQLRKASYIFLVCLLFVLASCGSASSSTTSPSQVYVSFTSSASYAHVVREVTDLGLQLAIPCIRTTKPAQNSIESWTHWIPMGEKDVFTPNHNLWIVPTPLAPYGWVNSLQALSDVQQVQTQFGLSCPSDHIGTPPAGTVVALRSDQAGVYARITFSLSKKQYDQALYLVSNVGLRLADPCYEQAKTKTWHQMGQETAFARQQTLIVATTDVTADNWQSQLQQSHVVTAITFPFKEKC